MSSSSSLVGLSSTKLVEEGVSSWVSSIAMVISAVSCSNWSNELDLDEKWKNSQEVRSCLGPYKVRTGTENELLSR
eukprot:3526821-Ditylum_brightwellii.AAC.1